MERKGGGGYRKLDIRVELLQFCKEARDIVVKFYFISGVIGTGPGEKQRLNIKMCDFQKYAFSVLGCTEFFFFF